jgi:hypothetical protein
MKGSRVDYFQGMPDKVWSLILCEKFATIFTQTVRRDGRQGSTRRYSRL